MLRKHKQVLTWRKASKAMQKTLEHFWGLLCSCFNFLIKCHVKFAIRYILKNMRSAPHPYSEVLLYCSRLHTYVLYYYHGSRDSPPKPPALPSQQASKQVRPRRLACLGKMKRACSSAWVGESSAWVRPESRAC